MNKPSYEGNRIELANEAVHITEELGDSNTDTSYI